MSGKRPEDVREKDVQGLKAPAALATFARGRLPTRQAGNRQLHFNQYCMLVLLFLFNPVVRSLRAIQQASKLKIMLVHTDVTLGA